MSKLPKLVVVDRDGVINLSSSDPASPLYYITSLHHLILKPGAREAMAILSIYQHTHNIPIILATKQRCIGKGLVSHEQVDMIHARLERLLDIQFDEILVEPKAEDKRGLYQEILSGTYGRRMRADDIHVFDDSEKERDVAESHGMTAHDGSNLFEAVCAAFNVR